MKDFEPIEDRVLLKRDLSGLEKKANSAGLVLPGTVKQNYQSAIGTIIKCGPLCRDSVANLLNKKVLVSHYSGIDVKIGEDDYLLVSDADILGEVND